MALMSRVFTEQGVSTLSTVLRSDTAIDASVRIMDCFVEMRRFVADNAAMTGRMQQDPELHFDKWLFSCVRSIFETSISPAMSLGRRLSRRDSSLLFSKLFARTASYIDCNLALKDKRLSLGGTGKDNALRIDVVILGTAEPEFIDAKSSRFTY